MQETTIIPVQMQMQLVEVILFENYSHAIVQICSFQQLLTDSKGAYRAALFCLIPLGINDLGKRRSCTPKYQITLFIQLILFVANRFSDAITRKVEYCPISLQFRPFVKITLHLMSIFVLSWRKKKQRLKNLNRQIRYS